MLGSSRTLEPQELHVNGTTSIMSENSVKALGVIIDNRLKFSQHVSACCTKAARQLNALARISRYLDVKSRKIIYQSFISSNFSYCPLVWHFCGIQNNNKLEKNQERSLRILYGDYVSLYTDLLSSAGTSTILISRLKQMLIEILVNNQNPSCLDGIFQINQSSYSLRDQLRLHQPKFNSANYGLRTFSYSVAKLWNDLPSHINTTRMTI